jgi:hypothetical protein
MKVLRQISEMRIMTMQVKMGAPPGIMARQQYQDKGYL